MNNEQNAKKVVALSETQPVTAKGVEQILSGLDNLQFGQAVSSLDSAITYAHTHKPDILILDKAMGIQPILETLTRLNDLTNLAIVVWGNTVTESEALRLLQAGARGIARKTIAPQTLVRCLETVASGHTWMEDTVFRDSIRADRASRSELTAREQQVAQLVEQGLKNKEIGRLLGIRPGTVKIHLKHIFEKTGVRGRYGLALTGLRVKGVVPALKM